MDKQRVYRRTEVNKKQIALEVPVQEQLKKSINSEIKRLRIMATTLAIVAVITSVANVDSIYYRKQLTKKEAIICNGLKKEITMLHKYNSYLSETLKVEPK